MYFNPIGVYMIIEGCSHLAQVGIAAEEFLDVWSALHCINQMHQSWIVLQSLSSILNQILIMQ